MDKKYEITITETAKKQLNKLPFSTTDKLITAIKALAKNPRPSDIKS
jgi:mRNA-degrading endonuclease RelE of RelBE toxin-antitoxin system